MTSIWVGELKPKLTVTTTASRDLPPLMPGQYVYTRPIDHQHGEQWCNGEVLGDVTPRSHVIKTQDRLVRRNRIHLRPNEPQVPCDPQPLPEQPVIDSGADVGNAAETIVPNPLQSPRMSIHFHQWKPRVMAFQLDDQRDWTFETGD